MPRAEARGGMATGDRAVAIRAKAGWASVEIKSSCFGAVSLGFATDAPRGSAGSFTSAIPGCWKRNAHQSLSVMPMESYGFIR